MKHKLMQATLKRDAGRKLRGLVQLDDAYWDGQRRGYKRGRGSAARRSSWRHYKPMRRGHPRRMSLSCIKGFRLKKEVARWSQAKLAPGTRVHSDGLACFGAVAATGCDHRPRVMSGSGLARRRLTINWVDTILGNVKNAIHGT